MGLIEEIENAAEEIRRESAKSERLAELLASYSRLLPLAEKAAAQLRTMAATVSPKKSGTTIKGAMPMVVQHPRKAKPRTMMKQRRGKR